MAVTRSIKRIILGGSCWSAGQVFRWPGDVLVVERGAGIGGEYFNSYRRTTDWEADLASTPANRVRDLMAERDMLKGERTDFYGASPALYQLLKEHTDNYMLMTELETIVPEDKGFRLVVYTVSGRTELVCDELVDNTLACLSRPDWGRQNVTEKRLNAIVFSDTTITHDTLDVHPGREEREFIVSCPLELSDDWPAARQRLLEAWKQRPEMHRQARICSIGKEIAYSFKADGAEFAGNWHYRNPVCHANPLTALDAGFHAE